MNYLFVCSGNTCRSPMAEAIMAQYLKGAGKVASAGIAVQHAAARSPHADAALREIGLSLPPGGANPLTPEKIDWSDIVLCMELRHKESILFDYPFATGKIKSLAEWAGDTGLDIPDPYGGTLATYREVRDKIAELIRKGLHA